MVDTASLRRPAAFSGLSREHRRASGWLLTTATFLVGLLATLTAFYYTRSAEDTSARVQFAFTVNSIVDEVTDRLDSHVQTLWGTVGLLAANPDVSYAQWRAYVAALQLAERLPSTRAVGFARFVRAGETEAHVRSMREQGFPTYAVWPAGERQEHVVVAFSELLDNRSGTSFGFDMFTNPTRRVALERARDSGEPMITGKITLVRETANDPQPGFLLFLPVYRDGASPKTVEARRATLVGYAYSPFRAREFITNRVLPHQARNARAAFEIYDGAGVSEQNLLYRSPDFPQASEIAEPSPFVSTVAEIVAGRTWTFRVTQLRSSGLGINQYVPLAVLAAGLLISLLAGAVVGTLSLNRAQADVANRRLREDVAQRQKVEQQLRVSEAKFHRLFDNIPLPTFAISRDSFRYLEVNKAAVAKYGYSHDDFSRMLITDVRPETDRASMVRYMESVREQDSYGGESRHQLRDGTVIDVDITAHNIELDGRQATIVVANDITERKQAQAALAESEQQLRQSQKLEAVGQLTGGIAHDFNNILTVITGTIEILADGVAHDAKLAEIAKLIDEAASRGADLTRALLAFARRQPLQPRDVDINALVLGATKLFRSTLGEHIEIEHTFAGEPWPAFVDPGQLNTALLNLALNARDAMPGGGKLILETANVMLDDSYAQGDGEIHPGAYVMVAVSDTGTGISPDHRDKVFEPFFTTKDVGKGTGLGLSMVYGFVKQSGGHVRVYSEQGCGTTIKLYLPRAAEEPGVTAEDTSAPAISGGSEIILVVEDDELVRSYVTTQLAGMGYATRVAANAAEALSLVQEGAEFDLLFTDIVMPGGTNGRVLADEIRQCRPRTRVLFTSGFTEVAAVRHGRIEAGVNLLNKPYRTADLALRIREALDKPAERS